MGDVWIQAPKDSAAMLSQIFELEQEGAIDLSHGLKWPETAWNGNPPPPRYRNTCPATPKEPARFSPGILCCQNRECHPWWSHGILPACEVLLFCNVPPFDSPFVSALPNVSAPRAAFSAAAAACGAVSPVSRHSSAAHRTIGPALASTPISSGSKHLMPSWVSW